MRLQLPAASLGLAEHKHIEHALTLPEGFPYEAVFQRDAWAHVGVKLRQHDIVHVRDEKGSFYARLYVRAADRLWADVFELECVLLMKEPAAISGGLKVAHRGKAKWCVVREADNERIQSGFQTADDANAWLSSHTAKVAA